MRATDIRRLSEKTELRISGKTFSELLAEQNKSILNAASTGRKRCIFFIHDTVWDEWEQEMKKHYLKLGYHFEPVGIISDVPQKDEYICW